MEISEIGQKLFHYKSNKSATFRIQHHSFNPYYGVFYKVIRKQRAEKAKNLYMHIKRICVSNEVINHNIF